MDDKNTQSALTGTIPEANDSFSLFYTISSFCFSISIDIKLKKKIVIWNKNVAIYARWILLLII